ncbi:MAG: TFIIB-type zinc ribbon-containing protein [Candidatus Bathyarchaeia archaeon]
MCHLRKSDKSDCKSIQNKCDECGSTNLIQDYEKGEIVCQNCGLIIQEITMVSRFLNKSATSDQWDGTIDNIERILEDHVSKKGWLI